MIITDKKINVLEVITLKGSADAFIGDQLSFFQENGNYEMHLICSPDPTLDVFAQKYNIKYKAIKICRTLSILNDILAFFQIFKYILRNNIKILIAHNFPKACLLSMTAGFLARVPIRIEIAHGALQEGVSGFLRKLVICTFKYTSFLATKVIIVSKSVAQVRINDGIDKKEKQVILLNGSSNGVDAINFFNPDLYSIESIKELKQQYNINDDDIIIGFCGRLVHDKGVTELLEGFDKICKKYKEKRIKLLIIGAPEKRDALPQKTIDILNNNVNIVFTGRIPYKDIPKYYLLMNMLVLPSYREGFPTVVLEASAMRIPVIVSRKTGCIDSIQENITGIYTDIDNDNISLSIEKLLDEQIARKMGDNGRKWVLANYEHILIKKAMFNFVDNLQKQYLN